MVVRRRGLRKVGGCGYKRAIGEILVIVGGILVIMKLFCTFTVKMATVTNTCDEL